MKITIKSDYLDCYDHWFDRRGTEDATFSRVAEGSWTVTRSEMFETFKSLGLQTPRFDYVCRFHADTMVVVYVDQNAHQGEGKLLIRAGDAARLYVAAASAALSRGQTSLTSLQVDEIIKEFKPGGPGAPERGKLLTAFHATEYVPDFRGVSWRLLSCGGKRTIFRHNSFDDWRSNAGDGDLFTVAADEVLISTGWEASILNPVWAIDFVARRDAQGKAVLLAVDFNTAPKVAGTPLAKIWRPEELARGIREAIETAQRETGPAHLNDRLFVYNNNIIRLAHDKK